MDEEKGLASTLNELRDEAYEIAKEKGFHDEEHPDYHWLMLIICEIAEAVEADRCGRHAELDEFDRLLPTTTFKDAFERRIKDTVEDELADVCIRILDFMGMKGWEVPSDIVEYIHKYIVYRSDNPQEFAAEMLLVTKKAAEGDWRDGIIDTLRSVLAICAIRSNDILRHIRMKMEYNRTRPYRHGKRY